MISPTQEPSQAGLFMLRLTKWNAGFSLDNLDQLLEMVDDVGTGNFVISPLSAFTDASNEALNTPLFKALSSTQTPLLKCDAWSFEVYPVQTYVESDNVNDLSDLAYLLSTQRFFLVESLYDIFQKLKSFADDLFKVARGVDKPVEIRETVNFLIVMEFTTTEKGVKVGDATILSDIPTVALKSKEGESDSEMSIDVVSLNNLANDSVPNDSVVGDGVPDVSVDNANVQDTALDGDPKAASETIELDLDVWQF